MRCTELVRPNEGAAWRSIAERLSRSTWPRRKADPDEHPPGRARHRLPRMISTTIAGSVRAARPLGSLLVERRVSATNDGQLPVNGGGAYHARGKAQGPRRKSAPDRRPPLP